jgi:exo-beta-1,3-glucanase (GH17 family)
MTTDAITRRRGSRTMLAVAAGAALAFVALVGATTRWRRRDAAPRDFASTLASVCWAAYSMTSWNPQTGREPANASVRQDLEVLKATGFDGIVTYDANLRVARFAQELGFTAVILGVWDPTSTSELARARTAAALPVVIGYSVGNEGLNERYDYETLNSAIVALRAATAKPVTTTEQIEDYADPKVVAIGDWVFANVHPYFHSLTDSVFAVEWTRDRFEAVSARTQKPVLFKEVGLPSAGDPRVNEAHQAGYYRALSRTAVRFVWFEAFDQPWKAHLPIEPHWGLFDSSRKPKAVVQAACGNVRK